MINNSKCNSVLHPSQRNFWRRHEQSFQLAPDAGLLLRRSFILFLLQRRNLWRRKSFVIRLNDIWAQKEEVAARRTSFCLQSRVSLPFSARTLNAENTSSIHTLCLLLYSRDAVRIIAVHRTSAILMCVPYYAAVRRFVC